MENCDRDSNIVNYPPGHQDRMEERNSFPPMRLEEKQSLVPASKSEDRTLYLNSKRVDRPEEYSIVKPESPTHFPHKVDERISIFSFHKHGEGSQGVNMSPGIDGRALDFTPSRPTDVSIGLDTNSDHNIDIHEDIKPSSVSPTRQEQEDVPGEEQVKFQKANSENMKGHLRTVPYSAEMSADKFMLNKMDLDIQEESPKQEPEISSDNGAPPEIEVKTVEDEPLETKPKLAELDSKPRFREETPNATGEFVKVETNENIFCRLCANPTSTGVNMLHPDGLEMNLIEKLTKTMPLRIASDDPLPKTVCYTCLDRFDQCFNFMEQIYRGHRTMVQQLVLGAAVDDDRFDKSMEGFIYNSSFFTKTFNSVKNEDSYEEPYFEYQDLYEEDEKLYEEEKPKKKKKRGRKPKGSKDEGKDTVPKAFKSKKIKKIKSVERLKLRFVPSLTTCAECGFKSESCKDNLEHWNRAHTGLPVAYK